MSPQNKEYDLAIPSSNQAAPAGDSNINMMEHGDGISSSQETKTELSSFKENDLQPFTNLSMLIFVSLNIFFVIGGYFVSWSDTKLLIQHTNTHGENENGSLSESTSSFHLNLVKASSIWSELRLFKGSAIHEMFVGIGVLIPLMCIPMYILSVKVVFSSSSILPSHPRNLQSIAMKDFFDQDKDEVEGETEKETINNNHFGPRNTIRQHYKAFLLCSMKFLTRFTRFLIFTLSAPGLLLSLTSKMSTYLILQFTLKLSLCIIFIQIILILGNSIQFTFYDDEEEVSSKNNDLPIFLISVQRTIRGGTLCYLYAVMTGLFLLVMLRVQGVKNYDCYSFIYRSKKKHMMKKLPKHEGDRVSQHKSALDDSYDNNIESSSKDDNDTLEAKQSQEEKILLDENVTEKKDTTFKNQSQKVNIAKGSDDDEEEEEWRNIQTPLLNDFDDDPHHRLQPNEISSALQKVIFHHPPESDEYYELSNNNNSLPLRQPPTGNTFTSNNNVQTHSQHHRLGRQNGAHTTSTSPTNQLSFCYYVLLYECAGLSLLFLFALVFLNIPLVQFDYNGLGAFFIEDGIITSGKISTTSRVFGLTDMVLILWRETQHHDLSVIIFFVFSTALVPIVVLVLCFWIRFESSCQQRRKRKRKRLKRLYNMCASLLPFSCLWVFFISIFITLPYISKSNSQMALCRHYQSRNSNNNWSHMHMFHTTPSSDTSRRTNISYYLDQEEHDNSPIRSQRQNDSCLVNMVGHSRYGLWYGVLLTLCMGVFCSLTLMEIENFLILR